MQKNQTIFANEKRHEIETGRKSSGTAFFLSSKIQNRNKTKKNNTQNETSTSLLSLGKLQQQTKSVRANQIIIDFLEQSTITANNSSN